MRKYVAPVLCAVLMMGTAVVTAGCKASASAQTGGGEAQPPPPPPPPPAPPPPKEEPKVEKPAPKKKLDFHVEGGQLKLPGPVVFETGSDKLKPESDEVLGIVKDYLDAKPEITLLRVEGHTDMDGDDKSNQALSEKRSMSVARWLVGKGIDCKRIIPVGFGESKPIAGTKDKQTEDEKSQNRRTAFVNASLKGKPIGGMPVDGGGKVGGDPCK
jgi:OOP family OmpA-OmpF porin